MTERGQDPLGMFEPLAAAIRAAMDAHGLTQADVARMTGLAPQTVSQLVNRRRPYGRRAPDASTQQALARVPGLPIGRVQKAVVRSLGMVVGDDRPEASKLRQSAHDMVDQIPEADLHRVTQILRAMIQPFES